MFNFKYIKDRAKPGSWRRGYEYYRKNMVLESSLAENIINAKVKGSFQDSYSIQLILDENNISAKCDCPLEEEWCKHAVCVGINAVEKHFHEQFLTEKTGQIFVFEDENPIIKSEFEGNYKFILNPSYKPKFSGIKVIDRSTNQEINDFEKLLKAVIEIQKSIPDFEFNQAQKVELSIIQYLYKNSKFHENTNFHSIPMSKFSQILSLLCMAEDVVDTSLKSISFQKEPWKLILTVNVSMVGNVLLSLHWHRPDKDDVLPFEEVKYFSKEIKWGQYKSVIFPTDTAISIIPNYLVKSTFTDIRDADGGKFIYEELPKLKKLMTVDVAEYLEKLSLEKHKPKNILYLDYDETEEEELKLTLEFEYEGVKVPYGKLANKTPYVIIKKPKEEILYWIKRNLKFEENAYKIIQKQKLVPMQTNKLSAKLDDAIDFYNEFAPKLNESWTIIEDENVSKLKTSTEPLKIHANIDFDTTVDSFTLEISCAVGKNEISLDEVQTILQQGK
ncbi:MAG: hypothetical protein PHV68_08270, partial [Candidatus Gastranaerophilales bacterium]|nr:hypothetical protein [Candidatus Gastranaerophilales bacterium]